MYQLSFASFSKKQKQTSVDKFLSEMDKVIPWKRLIATIEPFYYSGKFGRKPMKLELMLRIYFLQQWFNLGDPSIEEAIYDRRSFERFVRIDLMLNAIPDETTILNFRHLLEEHNLTEKIFTEINTLLEEKGLLIKTGTIVDATIIKAPSSTKNNEQKRDPEMTSTRKNGTWHFGMKLHIGTDSKHGLIHSLQGTTAKINDVEVLPELLHGYEEAIFGDKGYYSKDYKKSAREAGIFWGVSDRASSKYKLTEGQKRKNKLSSKVRWKVEHSFQVIKHQWGHIKTRYRGLKKNIAQFFTLAGLANLYKMRKKISFC